MRPIDADEFLQRALGTGCFRDDFAIMLQELVSESTTLSPDEVRGAGEWIECPSTHIQDGAKYRMCSVCNEHIAVLGHDLIYCPNCGARMKGAEDGTTDNS